MRTGLARSHVSKHRSVATRFDRTYLFERLGMAARVLSSSPLCLSGPSTRTRARAPRRSRRHRVADAPAQPACRATGKFQRCWCGLCRREQLQQRSAKRTPPWLDLAVWARAGRGEDQAQAAGDQMNNGRLWLRRACECVPTLQRQLCVKSPAAPLAESGRHSSNIGREVRSRAPRWRDSCVMHLSVKTLPQLGLRRRAREASPRDSGEAQRLHVASKSWPEGWPDGVALFLRS